VGSACIGIGQYSGFLNPVGVGTKPFGRTLCVVGEERCVDVDRRAAGEGSLAEGGLGVLTLDFFLSVA
jgi:hypothetical protein